jgi:hypothetical protein
MPLLTLMAVSMIISLSAFSPFRRRCHFVDFSPSLLCRYAAAAAIVFAAAASQRCRYCFLRRLFLAADTPLPPLIFHQRYEFARAMPPPAMPALPPFRPPAQCRRCCRFTSAPRHFDSELRQRRRGLAADATPMIFAEPPPFISLRRYAAFAHFFPLFAALTPADAIFSFQLRRCCWTWPPASRAAAAATLMIERYAGCFRHAAAD